MTDVARAAGVHQTTVSLALRNSPKLPPETRKRIQAIARDLGYRADPLVSALMTQVHSGRRDEDSPVLVWLNPLAPGLFQREASFAEFVRGFSEKAEELGFRAEELRCGACEGGVKDLAGHLYRRGIRAAFLPMTNVRKWIPEDASEIAFVALAGQTDARPIDTVGPNHFQNARLAARELIAAGSSRLAVIVPETFQVSPVEEWLGGCTVEAVESGLAQPALVRVDPDDHDALRGAIEDGAIDGVLAYPQSMRDTFARAGISPPGDMNYADPALVPGVADCAGIEPNRPAVGALAAESLVAQMHRGEFGSLEQPRAHLLTGRWVPGETVGGRRSSE